MQSTQYFRLATQWISAVLLSGFALTAAADQMMHALPGTTPVQQVKPSGAAPVLQPGPPPVATAPSKVIAAPLLLPEIVAGSGLVIGGKSATFTNATPVNINSTVMMPTAITPTTCRFAGKFDLKNTGNGAAPMFDVFTMADSSARGDRSNKTGYSIPGMAAGASYSQNFSLDLQPGIYGVILDIDPYHKLKQATSGSKKYVAWINVSCGSAPIGGGIRKKPAPYIQIN